MIDFPSILTGVAVTILSALIIYLTAKFSGKVKMKQPLVWYEKFNVNFMQSIEGKVIAENSAKYIIENLSKIKLKNIELLISGNAESCKIEPNRHYKVVQNENGLILSFDNFAPKEKVSIEFRDINPVRLSSVMCDGIEMEFLYNPRVLPSDMVVLPMRNKTLFWMLLWISIILGALTMALAFAALRIDRGNIVYVEPEVVAIIEPSN